jgi:hypothetical protein
MPHADQTAFDAALEQFLSERGKYYRPVGMELQMKKRTAAQRDVLDASTAEKPVADTKSASVSTPNSTQLLMPREWA